MVLTRRSDWLHGHKQTNRNKQTKKREKKKSRHLKWAAMDVPSHFWLDLKENWLKWGKNLILRPMADVILMQTRALIQFLNLTADFFNFADVCTRTASFIFHSFFFLHISNFQIRNVDSFRARFMVVFRYCTRCF